MLPGFQQSPATDIHDVAWTESITGVLSTPKLSGPAGAGGYRELGDGHQAFAPTSVARLTDHSGGARRVRIERIDGVVHRGDEHHVVPAMAGNREVRQVQGLRVDQIRPRAAREQKTRSWWDDALLVVSVVSTRFAPVTLGRYPRCSIDGWANALIPAGVAMASSKAYRTVICRETVTFTCERPSVTGI